MPSHRLIVQSAPKSGEWLLEWGEPDAVLRVRTPNGEVALEHPLDTAHRVIDRGALEVDGKVSICTNAGQLTFKRNKAAVQDVHALLLHGLRHDVEYREAEKTHARRVVKIAPIAFVIAAGLFTAYCIFAAYAPDPPKAWWMMIIGAVIHLVLLVLLATVLGAPIMFVKAVRQLHRIRDVERSFPFDVS